MLKRTILMTGIALILSAGLLAQSTDKAQEQTQNRKRIKSASQTEAQTQTQQQTGDQLKTQKRDQLKIHDQTGTDDQLQKKDRLRVHDKTQLRTQDQPHKASMAKAGNNSQMRSASKNGASGINASRHGAVKMSGGVKGGRR